LLGGTLQTNGNGNITLTGIGNGTIVAGNGVVINSSSTLSSANGTVSVTGYGGGTGTTGTGVYLGSTGTNNISTIGGNISVAGTTNPNATGNQAGIDIFYPASITSTTGNISLTGTANYNGGNAWGIYMAGGTVSTGGTGTIEAQGTGGNSAGGFNYGIYMAKSTIVSRISSTGSGNITVTGIGGTGGGSNYGLATDSNSESIGGASASGDITLKMDAWSLGTGTNVQTTGNITVKPYTASTSIGVAGGAGTWASAPPTWGT
jgi:hypothetical protein